MWARIHVVHEQAHTRISIRILGNKLAVVALGTLLILLRGLLCVAVKKISSFNVLIVLKIV